MSNRLSDVTDEFISVLVAQGKTDNTIKTYRYALDKLLAHVGNLQVSHINDRHIDDLFAKAQAKGLSPSTLNIMRNAVRALFAYCTRRRYINERRNPCTHIPQFRVMPAQKLRIPATKFPSLLDSAGHPRDRILVALGLYLFLRASEVQALRVCDLNLDDGELHVQVIKTRQRDVMPVSNELDRELRRWLTHYTQDQQAPLEPDWYLVPAKGAPRPEYDPELKRWTARYGERNLAPEVPISGAARRVRDVLERSGYPTKGRDGKSLYEGVHTLRRSGARALFDQRLQAGYDGALREVQAMLHHSTAAMTERYLGIALDVEKRNRSIKGQDMFPVSPNVVELRQVR